MLRVSPGSTAISRSGPCTLASLAAGAELLCSHQGRPRWVPLRSLQTLHDSRSTAILVLTDGGELLLHEDSAVVTTSGLQRAAELAMLRDIEAIGRMEGQWPLLERAATPATVSLQDLPRLFGRLASLSNIGSNSSPVYRVGSHPPEVLSAFEENAVCRPCSVEKGLAGWSWLLPSRQKLTRQGKGNVAALSRCALALWQSRDAEGLSLPIELEKQRCFSLATMWFAGRPYQADYRPRYRPNQVSLLVATDPLPHARIQAIVGVPNQQLVQLELREKGCYPIINGLLCGQ